VPGGRPSPVRTARREVTDLAPGVISDIAQAIRGRQPPPGMATKIAAVDGRGGAGKSTLADRLACELGGAQIVHTDDFASWENPLEWWPRLVTEVLEPLSHDERAEFVVLEGVGASREAFRRFLTYAIWIETPREVRLRRGLERDGEKARAQWESWMAEEDEYVVLERPSENGDVVVRGDLDLWV
jgi:uridine kinase